MDSLGGVRRGLAVALLALLVVGSSACSGGGGEAERSPDPREDGEGDEADENAGGGPDDEGAPGEDAGGDDEGDENQDDEGGAAAAADVQAAYVAYQQMFERLVIAPDADDPEIAQRASGAAEDEVVEVLGGYDSAGQAVEFGTRHEHHVFDVAVQADTATVLDCFVSDARVVDESSRQIVRGDPEGGSASVVTATLVLDGDEWRVDGTESLPVEPAQGCGPDGVIRRGT